MVLGHEACGALKATISSIQDNATLPGHLPSLVAALLRRSKPLRVGRAISSRTPLEKMYRLTVEALQSATPLLSVAVNDKRLKVVRGIYRLADGQVELIG